MISCVKIYAMLKQVCQNIAKSAFASNQKRSQIIRIFDLRIPLALAKTI